MSMLNILNAAKNLYQSHKDLKKFAKWPDDLTNSSLPSMIMPAAKLVENFSLNGTSETNPLIKVIKTNVNLAHWKRTYTEKEVGYDFLNRYGYYELFGPFGHFYSTQLRGFIGFWGNGLTYDWHSHEAEEIYLMLGGSALFRTKEKDIILKPNETRTHSSWQSHSMITNKEPILTFVLWKGMGIFKSPKMDIEPVSNSSICT